MSRKLRLRQKNCFLIKKTVCFNSFFPSTASLWNSVPVEYFPNTLTYDVNNCKSRIKAGAFYLEVLYNQLSFMLFIFFFLFIVNPCLLVLFILEVDPN